MTERPEYGDPYGAQRPYGGDDPSGYRPEGEDPAPPPAVGPAPERTDWDPADADGRPTPSGARSTAEAETVGGPGQPGGPAGYGAPEGYGDDRGEGYAEDPGEPGRYDGPDRSDAPDRYDDDGPEHYDDGPHGDGEPRRYEGSDDNVDTMTLPGGTGGPPEHVLPVGGSLPPHEEHLKPDSVPPRRPRRFRSPRRAASAVTALLLLGASGLLLFDTVRQRAFDEPPMAWRRSLQEELATRPLDSTWVLVGAGVAAVLGLWLLVLAITPGRRRLLAQRTPSGTIRSGIDRSAAAALLQDSALQVSGVSRAEVSVRRRRAVVRAQVRFRELDEVHRELAAVVSERIDRLAPGRTPKLTVKLREVRG